MMITVKHERDIKNINAHLRHQHGVDARGTVRLATFLRHRRLHSKGHMAVEHQHAERDG
jgi:hypothetical protein